MDVKHFFEHVHIFFQEALVGESIKPVSEESKSVKTRARIMETALRLFADKGYHQTTMRDIAREAGASLGLAYRYFESKEDMVLAFYEQCTIQLEEEIASLPPGKLADRLERALRADLARIAPYRAAFGALFGVALDPSGEASVLGERVAHIRARIWRVFHVVITEAADAPKPRQAAEMATLFYGGHLLLVLFWLQDRTPGQRSTEEMITLARQLVARLRPALMVPFASRMLGRIAAAMNPLFGPPAEAAS